MDGSDEGGARADMDQEDAGAMHGPSNSGRRRNRTVTVPAGPAGEAVLQLVATVNELAASKDEAYKLADKKTRLLHKKKAKLNDVWKERDDFKKERDNFKKELDQRTKAFTDELEERNEQLGERTEKLEQRTKERDHLLQEIERLKQTPSLTRLQEVEGQDMWKVDVSFKDYMSLADRTRQLTQEHLQLSWECAENIQAYDECVKEGDDKVDQVRAQRNTARQEKTKLEAEVTKLKEDKTQLEADKTQLEADKTQLEARVAALARDLKQAQDKKRIDKKEGKKRLSNDDHNDDDDKKRIDKKRVKLALGAASKVAVEAASDDDVVDVTPPPPPFTTWQWVELDGKGDDPSIHDKINFTKGYHIVIRCNDGITTTLFWPHTLKDGTQTSTTKYKKKSVQDGYDGQRYIDMFNDFEICHIPNEALVKLEECRHPKREDAAREIILNFTAIQSYKERMEMFLPRKRSIEGNSVEGDSMYGGGLGGLSDDDEVDLDEGGSSTATPKSKGPGSCVICGIISGKQELRECPASIYVTKEKGKSSACPFRLPYGGNPEKQKEEVDKTLADFGNMAIKYYPDAKPAAIEEAKSQYDKNFAAALARRNEHAAQAEKLTKAEKTREKAKVDKAKEKAKKGGD